jgi:hypothetical protein
MKNSISLLLATLTFCMASAQAYNPVTLMLAYQKKYAASPRFSGQARWNNPNGDPFTGRFVAEGEKYQVKWEEGELRCDGIYEWEIITRSKRIKKRYYDPLLAPGVVDAFRFVRLDLSSGVVRLGGTADQITIDIDPGCSVAQGSYVFTVNQQTLAPASIATMVDREWCYERAEFLKVQAFDAAEEGEYTLDFSLWKDLGYTLTDMSKGECEVVWPVEKALR